MCSATQPTGPALPDPATQSVGRRRAYSIPIADSNLSAESDEVSSRSTVPALDKNSSLLQRNPHDTMESEGSEIAALAISPPESPGCTSLPSQFGPNKHRGNLRRKLLKMVSGVHRKGTSSSDGSFGRAESSSSFNLDHHHSNHTGSLSTPTTPLQTSRLHSEDTKSLQHSFPYHKHQLDTVTSVHINLSQYKLGGALNPCSLEKLGIVPCRSDLRMHSLSLTNLRKRSSNKEKRRQDCFVIIKGIIPASPAALTGMLEPGDHLAAVCGLEVNLANVEEILSEMMEELVLDVIKMETPQATPTIHHVLSPSTSFISLNEPSMPEVDSFSTPPATYLALYLTLDTREEDEPCKDILFQYPVLKEGEAQTLPRLRQLRGVFLTLADILQPISSSKDSCCSVEVERELFHIACRQYGRELLVIALPAALVSTFVVQQMMDTIEMTLNLLCGSINSAFTSHGNHQLVSRFLSSLILYHLTNPSPHAAFYPALHTVSLPTSLGLRITGRMNQLDASDCSSHLSVLLTRRSYIPLGSCLFHRGCLVCSHLAPSLLQPVAQLAHANNLLTVSASQPLPHTTLWQEVYLARERQEEVGCKSVYQELYGRTFVLIIAMEHSLLCQVMEAQQGVGLSPPPDPYCIEQCRAILTDLHTSGILSAVDGRVLLSRPSPCLVSADILLAAHISRTAHHQHSSSSTSSKKKSPSSSSLHSLQQVSTASCDDDDQEVRHPSSPVRFSRLGRLSLQMRRSHSAISPDSLTTPSPHSLHARPPYTLTAGPDNLLLHYVLLENGRGVLLTPFPAQVSSQPVHQRLLSSFRHAAAELHVILQRQWQEDQEEEDEAEEADDNHTKNSNQRSCQLSSCGDSPVLEHGLLLECSVVRSAGSGLLQAPPKVHYWVVGRLFPERNQELFVCFQESSSQMFVEMAFKLLFGSMW